MKSDSTTPRPELRIANSKVLVVDDEESIRISVREFLKDAGCEVDVAEDADEAMAILAAKDFDVVVTDIILPRVTGVSLLNTIKKTSPHVQVILITGEPVVETASEAVRAGAFDYLAKPIGREPLLKSVANAAKVKALDDERRRLAEENRQYQENLKRIVEERTAALRESEKRMELALQGADLGTWDWNVRTGDLTINERWAEMLGHTLSEIEPRLGAWEKLVHPDDMPDVQEVLNAHLKGKTDFYETEHRLKHKSGEWVWVLDKGRVFERDADGKPLRVCGTHFDITERKRVEEEKIQFEEQYHLTQKMESIGRLAGGIAHDLNNLLSPILGYSDMLLNDLDPDDARRESVDTILRAGFGARDLVRQLLAFSRKQTLEYKLVDINKVVTDVEKLLRSTIREDIKMEVILSPDTRFVRADIGQIEQVLMNLVVNAQDAMPDGGQLTIETTQGNLNETLATKHQGVQPGEYVMLSVSDTGFGMDDETREHLFEPFFSTKGKQGTGLGLATSYGIIKQHGGSICVYSELSKGTTFEVYLPVSEKDHVKQKTAKRTSADLKGSETILLVEDSDEARDLAHAMLKRQGYKVLVAKNGTEALAVLASHRQWVHLLLTDVIMPEMNGRDLFVKAVEKRPGLRVLYMSGYTDDVIAHKGVLEEGIAFIQKPFTVNALAAKVRDVLEQE